MRIRLQTLITIFILGALSCTPKIQSHFAGAEDLERLSEPAQARSAGFTPCNDYLAYAPDTLHPDHLPMKYIRVNVHFMNSSDSSRNFNFPEGIEKANALINAANRDLEYNKKLFLPLGNDIPVLPTQYRLKITPRPGDPTDVGVYFHYDDDLYYYVMKGKNDNRSKRQVIDQYGLQLDTVLNIFLMPHHPDSVASPTYKPHRGGIALNNGIKVTGWYETNGSEWDVQYVLNHEIGHILTLMHTWAYNDGCDDTPYNPKCWNFSDTPPCDSLVSNNVMDYNAYQNAWSPCQIGKIHYALSRDDLRCRRFLEPNWCELHEERHIFIRDSIHWKSAKDLEGHLTIQTGGVLQISCRVSLPRNAVITVEPGGLLILDQCRLYNACGDNWQGIKILETGGKKGKVTLIGRPVIDNILHPFPID
ncbi:MAG: hypothetical protein IPL49_00490 [Saprospirales bacterium]|nr:hypothetical protein [Saprospirales bacterium]